MQTEVLNQCILCHSSTLRALDPTCNIAQCPSCGFIFDNPRPTLAELVAFYSKPSKYDPWLDELTGRQRMWNRRLSKLQAFRKPGTLLDIGAGIGQFLDMARPYYTEVHGTEVSSAAVAIARNKYNLEFFEGTIGDLSRTSKVQFDNITLFHVLEHVPDPREVLAECHSLLSDDGILVIAVPNEVASLRSIVRRLLVKLGLKEPAGRGRVGLPLIRLDGTISEVHLSHFTPRVLRRLLEDSGFSVVSSTLDPYYVRRTSAGWMKADVYYYLCLAAHALFRVNLFDAMLVIGRKQMRSQPAVKVA